MNDKSYLSDVTAENLYAGGKMSMDLLWNSKWDMRSECRVLMRRKRLERERERECNSATQSNCTTVRSLVGSNGGVGKDEIAALYNIAVTNFDVSSPLYSLSKQINLSRVCNPVTRHADPSTCTDNLLTYLSNGQLPISSPRSAIILLRNGVSLETMTPTEQRTMKAKYLILCEQTSVEELCEEFATLRERHRCTRSVINNSNRQDASSVSSNGATLQANAKLRYLQKQIQIQQQQSLKEQQREDRMQHHATIRNDAARERKLKKMERFDQLEKQRMNNIRNRAEANQRRQQEVQLSEQRREEMIRQAREEFQKKAEIRTQSCVSRLKNARDTLESEIAARTRTFEEHFTKLQERDLQKKVYKQTVLQPIVKQSQAALQGKREQAYNKCLLEQTNKQAAILNKQDEEDRRLDEFKRKTLDVRQEQKQKFFQLENMRNHRLVMVREQDTENSLERHRRCLAADAAADAAADKLRQKASEKRENIRSCFDQCGQRVDRHLRSAAFKKLQKIADIEQKSQRVDLLLHDREILKRNARERQEQQRLQQELAEKELLELQDAERKKAFFALQMALKANQKSASVVT